MSILHNISGFVGTLGFFAESSVWQAERENGRSTLN